MCQRQVATESGANCGEHITLEVDRRILGYLSWQGLSVLAQACVQFGLIALLARFLSPTDFGLVAAANIAVTFVQMLGEGGIGSAVVRQPDVSGTLASTALSMALAIGLVCFALLLVIAYPFEQFFKMEGLAEVLVVLALSSLFAGPSSVLEAILQRDLRFADLFRINILGSLVGQAIPTLVLAALGAGAWSIVAGTLGRFLVKCAALAWMAGSRVRLHWEPGEGGQFLRFGLGLTRDRLWNWVGAQVPAFAIGLLYGQALLGQFSIAIPLATLPFQHMSTVISAVFFPLASRALADSVGAGRQFMFVLTAVFIPMTALGFALALNGDTVVRIAFGSGWGAAVPVFTVLSLAAGVRGSIQVADTLNIARGDVHRLANRRLLSTVLVIVALWWSQGEGLVAGAWAIVTGHVAMLTFTVHLAYRGLGLGQTVGTAMVTRFLVSMFMLGLLNGALLMLREAMVLAGVPLLMCALAVNCVALVPIYMLLRPVLESRNLPGSSLRPA